MLLKDNPSMLNASRNETNDKKSHTVITPSDKGYIFSALRSK